MSKPLVLPLASLRRRDFCVGAVAGGALLAVGCEVSPNGTEPDLAAAPDLATAPDLQSPDLRQPDLGQPDLGPPEDLGQPDLNQPDFTQPDLNQPDLDQTDSSPPDDLTQPDDLSQPDLTQPDLTTQDLIPPQDLTTSPDLANVCGGSAFNTGLAPASVNQNTATFFSGPRLFVCRDSGGLFALSGICTHAGCNTNFNAGATTYDCPCHGARFTYVGAVQQGPASSPLVHYAMCLVGTSIGVDTSQIVAATVRYSL